MKKFPKILTGAAAAALLTTVAATPAQAQYRHYDRGGIDAGDIIAGVAILGGIAAVAAALDDDDDRYDYDDRYRDRRGYNYRDGYTTAVNACGYEARRYGRGQVRITDVDRRSRDRYRVRGVIEDGGYGYDRYGYGNRRDRDRFTCTAYGNGRISDFDVRG